LALSTCRRLSGIIKAGNDVLEELIMFKHRLRSGILLGGSAIIAFLWPGWPGIVLFSALALAFVSIGNHEYVALVRQMGWSSFAASVIGAGAVLYIAVAIAGIHSAGNAAVIAWSQALVTAAVVLVFGCRALFMHPPSMAITKLLTSLAGFLYVSWPLSFLGALYFADGTAMAGRLLAIYLVAVTKLADVGAYTLGTIGSRRPGGNHKLAPKISPKKSWEGLAGGTIASVGAAVLLWLLLRRQMVLNGQEALAFTDAIAVGIAASIIGLFGDLIESLFKRGAGAKDSGAIPGLGGVLDVADSLIPMAPLFYLLVRYNTGF